MWQALLHRCPATQAEYRFVCRNPGKTMCEDGTFLAYLRQVFVVISPR
jgi:hypothetical protein